MENQNDVRDGSGTGPFAPTVLHVLLLKTNPVCRSFKQPEHWRKTTHFKNSIGLKIWLEAGPEGTAPTLTLKNQNSNFVIATEV